MTAANDDLILRHARELVDDVLFARMTSAEMKAAALEAEVRVLRRALRALQDVSGFRVKHVDPTVQAFSLVKGPIRRLIEENAK